MAKIIHYRDKCIGCGVCFELQPEIWRMSKKDGKATLLRAIEKKSIHILPMHFSIQASTIEVAKACPVKIIKIV
jgi:ferredoxin